MKKVRTRIHKRAKTERIYEPVHNVTELCRVIEGHGDKVLFSYFRADHVLSDMTYGEFAALVRRTAAGLTELGFAGKKIAVIGETCPEWICSYLAIMVSGGVVVPMDRELSPDEIVKFMNWVGADAIAYAPSLNETMAKLSNEGTGISAFFPFTDTEKKDNVICFGDIGAAGDKAVEAGWDFPDASDRENELAEYLFTSGTTGSSKCVMLSQKNVFSTVTCACETVEFFPDDTIVSVLPMHHTYELMCTLAAMDYGTHVCITDSLSHVIKNFKRFKPTGLVLVPLFVNTMYKKIWAEAKKKGKTNALKAGMIASGTLGAAGIDIRRKVFGEVLDAFGGRLNKIVSGGAPLDPIMIDAFEHFGVSVYEGYGITECSPLAAVTPYYARKYGSVGPAVPCCELRISEENSSVGEAGYLCGEIEVKGDNVMMGYYDNDEANAAAFTEDGWFRTGDIGYLDDDGYLFITGRQKSVIVLENGKNVFPEEIEEYLSQIELIAESVVVGRNPDGGKIELTAIVYPNYEKFPKDADEETVMRTLEHEIAVMNRKLPSFKRIMRIEIRSTEFEKTSARKIKRHLVS